MSGLAAVVILYRDSVTGQSQYLLVGDAEPTAIRLAGRNIGGGLTSPALGVDHTHLLASEPASQHRPKALGEGGLVNVELVGIDGPLHDVLAEPERPGDEHNVGKTRFGVQSEEDAAGGEVRPHHLHHPDRQGHGEVVETLVDAIADCSIGEQRSKAPARGFHHPLGAVHIQKALVLAGETGGREVLGRCRGANRHTQIGTVLLDQLLVGVGDTRDEVGRRGSRVDQLPGSAGAPTELGDVGLVERRHQLLEFPPQPGLLEGVSEPLGRDGEAVRNADTQRAQLSIELP